MRLPQNEQEFEYVIMEYLINKHRSKMRTEANDEIVIADTRDARFIPIYKEIVGKNYLPIHKQAEEGYHIPPHHHNPPHGGHHDHNPPHGGHNHHNPPHGGHNHHNPPHGGHNHHNPPHGGHHDHNPPHGGHHDHNPPHGGHHHTPPHGGHFLPIYKEKSIAPPPGKEHHDHIKPKNITFPYPIGHIHTIRSSEDTEYIVAAMSHILKEIYPYVTAGVNPYDYSGSPIYEEVVGKDIIERLVEEIFAQARANIIHIEGDVYGISSKNSWTPKDFLKGTIEGLIIFHIFTVLRPKMKHLSSIDDDYEQSGYQFSTFYH